MGDCNEHQATITDVCGGGVREGGGGGGGGAVVPESTRLKCIILFSTGS